jgi:hypothetical protein
MGEGVRRHRDGHRAIGGVATAAAIPTGSRLADELDVEIQDVGARGRTDERQRQADHAASS